MRCAWKVTLSATGLGRRLMISMVGLLQAKTTAQQTAKALTGTATHPYFGDIGREAESKGYMGNELFYQELHMELYTNTITARTGKVADRRICTMLA